MRSVSDSAILPRRQQSLLLSAHTFFQPLLCLFHFYFSTLSILRALCTYTVQHYPYHYYCS
ncbi:hypothetical protein BDF19DRAFT_451799 [Syncephalis fuscata]|nr:hypothetical protein BDF19DRAFT_451799 [Syncephalis fuscata]